jgi:multidrug resistance protein, MATE family
MKTAPKEKNKPGSVGEMITIALPMVVSFGCDTAMTFTDRLFLARLGPEYMSASMAGGLTCFTMMTFFIGLISYSTALVAQYLGAGRKERCSIFTTQAIFIAAVGYPVIVLCRPSAHLFFDSMGIAPGQLVLQKTYFDILLYGVVFSLLRCALASFFSGIGRTRIVMLASATAMIINIVLNYILIYGKLGVPALGIGGAALGMIIGGFSSCVVLLFAYFKRSNIREFSIARSFRFDSVAMVKLLRFGYPSGAEMFLNLFAFTIMVFLFHSGGSAAAAASTVAFNWDMVTFVPLLGIEIGVTSLVGRYMGAKRADIAHRTVMSGVKVGSMYAGIMFVLFVALPYQLVNVFNPGTSDVIFLQAQPMAVAMVKIVAVYVLAEVFFVVFTGALRGAGDTFWAMAISVFLHWLLTSIVFIMIKFYNLDVPAAWAALVIVFLIFSILPYLRYRQGKWKSIRVVEPEESIVVLASDRFHEPVDL